MLRFRQFKRNDIILHTTDRKVRLYNENIFYSLLNGDACKKEKFAPFRDEESLRVITELDKATLVDGEWYAMVTPFGKTCLSALSSGAKYALTVIENSKHGIYTEFSVVGDNVWKLLSELDIDILIAVTSSKHGDNYILFDVTEFIIENTGLGKTVHVKDSAFGITDGLINTRLIRKDNYKQL